MAFSREKKRGRNNDNSPRTKRQKTENDEKTEEKKQENSEKGDHEYADDKMNRRDYMFTINNYTESDMDVMDIWLKKSLCMQVQQEVGKEGTPHLQGYVYFKQARKRSVLFREIGKGFYCVVPDNPAACRNYCKKNETRKIDEKVWRKDWTEQKSKKKSLREKMLERCAQEFEEDYNGVVWKDWQQKILDLADKKPDRRSVYWFWEETGNIGKSFLAKYIRKTYGAFQLSGRMADCCKQIAMLMDSDMDIPKFCMYDLPRGRGNYCSYTFLEDLKNGYIVSTKNDTEGIELPRMHVVVFANQPPKCDDMSRDRWIITHIASEDNDVDVS